MALELVGGALLSSFLEVAFDRLASTEILDYFKAKRLDDKLLHELKISLLSINAVIDDAEDKYISNRNVSAWLDTVKDVVLDAEDLLDEVHTEASKSKLEAEYQTTTSKVWSYLSSSVSSFDKELQSRMKEILHNLEILARSKDILGLKEGVGVGLGKRVSQRLPTTSLVDERDVCGRDDDKKDIVDLLLSDNGTRNNLTVIAIVGMGGMGKTTLAQLAYNDSKMEDGFVFKDWVCVSEEFDVARITRTILKALNSSTDDTMDLNKLQVKLKEKLSGKKFLLVLDDVWNEDYLNWEALQTPFVYGARGSKILVTTRSEKVASTMRCAHLHQLKQLPEEDSWLLFTKYALRDADQTSSFEEIGKKIIKKCKGLPLALKTIGGLLYTKLSYEEWNGILSSKVWDISDDGCNIIPALRLSYQYLPSALKRCFAYCSLLPKDYEFDKDYLVELWMAENFLQFNQQNKSMKELGDQFFNDLLSRSFFQQSSGDGKLFAMHDLVNDLAKYVSREFCLSFEEEKEAKNVSKITRHFSYIRKSEKDSEEFEAIYKANKLRTFLKLLMHEGEGKGWESMSSEMIHDLLSKFKRLRVLSLCYYTNNFEVPDSISNLKHLRYLNLSGSGMKKLPDSTCLLYNLQTLKLTDCEYLEELPSDMQKLINLRHLDFRGTRVRKLPNSLGKLKNLEVLSSFYVGKCSESNINELSELKLRGTLAIEELQNVVDPKDAIAANLKNKIHLEGLSLGWSSNDDGSQNERDVLEKLQPPANLKELSIQSFGGTRFPDWFGDNYLCNIVSLELRDCKYCFSLPPLGILPSLEKLRIEGLEGIEVIGPEFYGNNSTVAPFESLQVLEFERMVGWEEWDCQNASRAFPCLEKLKIKDCPKLKNQLPEHLPSLLKLAILECMQLVASLPCAPQICHLNVQDCGNMPWESLPSTLLNSHSLNFLQSLELRRCDSLRAISLDLFPKLESLWLECCSELERFSISEGLDQSLASLKELRIYECPKFVSLGEGMHTLFPSLKTIDLWDCPPLEWCEGGFPSTLETLTIQRCPKVVDSRMKWDLDTCSSLSYFRIVDENVDSFPEQGLLPATLTSLSIWGCTNLKTLDYKGLCHLTSLKDLWIKECPRLQCLPKEGLPTSLRELIIERCPKVVASRMKWDLDRYTSLSSLVIEDENVDSFPEQGLLPSTLTSLQIWGGSNLKTLDYKGLCHLTSLERLSISNCPRLQCLPKEGLPTSLSYLGIFGDCPMLEERCQKQKGEDWSKIAHIPYIYI